MMLHSFLQRCKTFKMFALALLLFCAAAVQGETVVCDYYEDSACTTEAANCHWSELVSGRDGKWNSSKTLYLESYTGKADQMDVEFCNIELTGVENCVTTKVELDDDTKTYKYELSCDKLTATANYKLSGTFHDMELAGEGVITAVKEGYSVQYRGKFETSKVDGKTIMKLDSFDADYQINTVVYSLTNQSEATVEAINQDSQRVEKEVCAPVMDKLSEIFLMENVNDYMQWVSMEEMFTYEK